LDQHEKRHNETLIGSGRVNIYDAIATPVTTFFTIMITRWYKELK